MGTQMKEVLYHYTNVEALAMILKNKTLRFSSLDRLDDPIEPMAEDFEAPSKCCFVSSWTSNPDESIPMWREYASVSAGIRIGLKRNPFKIYLETPEQIAGTAILPDGLNVSGALLSRLSLVEQMKSGYICPTSFSKSEILHEVEYTDDASLLVPRIETSPGQFDLGKLGKYKAKAWEYQQEWRYIHLAFPIDIARSVSDQDNFLKEMAEKLRGTRPMGLPSYIDCPLDEQAIYDMEILLAPNISPGNIVIVHDLVEKYCPGVSIERSSLRMCW